MEIRVGALAGALQVGAMLKLLFIGDIVGRPGRDMVMERVPRLRQELALDFVIANAENVAAGAGITGKLAKSILESGVDAITRLGDGNCDDGSSVSARESPQI